MKFSMNHILKKTDAKNRNNRTKRSRCTRCYAELANSHGPEYARRRLNIEINTEKIKSETDETKCVQTTDDDLIPLHAGSCVYILKTDLLRIFTPDPLLYTSRLADIVFGRTLQEVSQNPNKDRITLLDQIRLQSLITHVVQLFVRRGTELTDSLVKRYIKQKLNHIRQKAMQAAKQ